MWSKSFTLMLIERENEKIHYLVLNHPKPRIATPHVRLDFMEDFTLMQCAFWSSFCDPKPKLDCIDVTCCKVSHQNLRRVRLRLYMYFFLSLS